jgi:hypothetical protein
MSAVPVRPLPPRVAPAQRRDFFVYALRFLSLGAGGTLTSQFQIQADSDFELQKLSCFADIAGAAQTESTRVLPLVTLQVTDTGTGRQAFLEPVPIPAIFGDGRIPFILPVTKVFSKNASVAVTLANFSAATAYNLRLAFIGAKIFTYS